MTNRNKIKGSAYERAVRDYLRDQGYPAETTRAGYQRDHGDVHLVTASGLVIVQAKNHARIDLPGWLAQLDQQRADARAAHGFLAIKRRGVGDPGLSYAVLTLAALVALLPDAVGPAGTQPHPDGR